MALNMRAHLRIRIWVQLVKIETKYVSVIPYNKRVISGEGVFDLFVISTC